VRVKKETHLILYEQCCRLMMSLRVGSGSLNQLRHPRPPAAVRKDSLDAYQMTSSDCILHAALG
jgi:hypothetical protein